jgi:poly(beta-D-mannuronate) lyase
MTCAFLLFLILVAKSLGCVPPPPAIKNVAAVSYYDDAAYSIISPERFALWKKLSQPINDFVGNVTMFARSGATEREHACAMQWLLAWARGRALLGVVMNGQAEMLRQWSIAGLSLAFHRLCARKRFYDASVAVAEWFVDCVKGATNAWNRRNPKHRRNNHLYWSGLAALGAGLAANDTKLIAYGRNVYLEAMSHITESGVLPLERERGRRILHYHCYALQPLMMMAELSGMLGENWYAFRDYRIGKLVRLAVGGLRNVALFESLSGLSDVEMPSGSQLAWLWLIESAGVAPSILPLNDVIDGANLMRDSFVPRLGGDVRDYSQKRFQSDCL